jgi:hypothetical protein
MQPDFAQVATRGGAGTANARLLAMRPSLGGSRIVQAGSEVAGQRTNFGMILTKIYKRLTQIKVFALTAA